MIYNENEPYINAISVLSFNIGTKVNLASEIYFQENPPVGIQYKDSLKYNFHAHDFYLTNDINKNHVYDIKSTNMLGRKELSYLSAEIDSEISSGFSLLHTDENFKYSPYKLQINSNVANVNWHIIEYSNDDVTDDNIETNNNTATVLKLAKPKLFKANIQNESTESIESIETIAKYYIFDSNNTLNIQYINNLNLDNDVLVYGPFNTLNECSVFISNWAQINNYTVNRINQYNYTYF
jgi:hypothetical protein